jgi:hypothetical protein
MGSEGGLEELPSSGNRYVDRSLSLASDPPQSGRAAVAQVGAWPAREHGGHPLGLAGLYRPSKGVDPRSGGVQPSSGDAMGDCVPAIPEPDQLIVCDLAVLFSRQGPNGAPALLL